MKKGQSEKPKKSKKKIDRSLLIALAAILINVITVSVYVYQTRLMQQQQYASAWPYLEWRMVYNQSDGFYMIVKNNGVGPAIIKNVSITYENEPVQELDSIMKVLADTTMFPYLYRDVNNRVIPPGGEIRPIQVNDLLLSELIYYRLIEKSFAYEICYESIYGEQWTSLGTEVVESKCDLNGK